LPWNVGLIVSLVERRMIMVPLRVESGFSHFRHRDDGLEVKCKEGS
jgi:hypothetical protein